MTKQKQQITFTDVQYHSSGKRGRKDQIRLREFRQPDAA